MSKISRRSFARDAVVIATAAAVMPSVVAQTPPAPPPDRPLANPATMPLPNPEIAGRVTWIEMKYGSRLDSLQRGDIRRLINGAQAGIDAMRAYPLGNDVAPPVPFRVWRKR